MDFLILIFSKDRELQLDAMLRSLVFHCGQTCFPACPPEAETNEKDNSLITLRKDYRNISSLIQLAEIEINTSNFPKAKNYLIAALVLEPDNIKAKNLLDNVIGKL